MKILFFSYAYPNPINRNQGTFNRTMIAGLAAEHEVRVLSPVSFIEATKAWIKGKLKRGLNDPSFRAIPTVPAEYVTWFYTPKWFRNSYGRFMRWSVGGRLRRAIREFQPDVVLSYWTSPDGEVAVQVAHEFDIKAVTIVGGSDVLVNARHGSRRKTILDVLYSADKVVTVSDDIRQVLIRDGVDDRKIQLIRRGTDRRVFHEGNKDAAREKLGLPLVQNIIVSVGRLVDVKGLTHLVDACQMMNSRGVDFHYYILGDGPNRVRLAQQIEQLGLQNLVTLCGAQTAHQLAEWYRAADVTVLPSLSEGVPNVLLESIASGTPFVASRVGGIPEIADLRRDILVPPGDAKALADAITRRLSTIHDDVAHPRRFVPPTMHQSAEEMANLLQVVATGCEPVRSESVMHEMMVERNLSANGDRNLNTLHSVTKSVVGEVDPDKYFDQQDELGRTGELSSSIREILVPPASNASES